MPHFVAFDIFSDIKKTFFSLFCSNVRFLFLHIAKLEPYLQCSMRLVLKIIFLVGNGKNSGLIIPKEKEKNHIDHQNSVSS